MSSKVGFYTQNKSNFTLWATNYIFTVFDFNEIKNCNELLIPALT